MADKKNKLRAPHGEGHTNAKLDRDSVREMRFEYAQGNIGLRELAQKYKISISAASKAITGKTWAIV